MAPPPDFSDLYNAYNASTGSFHSVIGVVVDLMEPSITKTNEHMVTFKILDPRLRDAVNGYQGLTVRFFKKDPQYLPRVRNLGDIVLLRDIKLQPWNQQPLLMANYQTTVVVFPSGSIPDPKFQVAFQGKDRLPCLGSPMDKEKVTLEEQACVIALKQDMKETVDGLPSTNLYGFQSTAPEEPAAKRPRLSEPSRPSRPPPSAPSGPLLERTRHSDVLPRPVARPQVPDNSFGPKFKLVKSLAHYDFADICAQVVKKYPLPYGGCDLYVSDYTSNDAMWYYTPPEQDTDISRDGDMFGYAGGPPKRQFPGPYEWNILKVNVKDPHAHFLHHSVAEGDFVLLRNVKMKVRSEGAKLEGDMWPDDRNREKVQVSKLMNHGLPEIQAVLERKEKYWASRNTKIENQANAKLSKSEKKRKKKKAKAEKKVAEAEAMETLLQENQVKKKVNPYVRCSNDEMPISSIKDILDVDNDRHTNDGPGGTDCIIPFINATYRARVRVVDYEPHSLEDFSVPAGSEDESDDENSISGMDWQTSPKWIWSFALLLQDASTSPAAESDRIWVAFGHEAAQYLLGNGMDDPADLREDGALLAKLREKLCILWGDLEEVKGMRGGDGGEEAEGGGGGLSGKLSNLPFECCVMEYGVRVDERYGSRGEGEAVLGYERMYACAGVTIT